MPPLWGLRRNIAMAFCMEKLEWLGYQTVKNFEHMITRFDTIHERDRQTHRQTHIHRMTAKAVLDASIVWQEL